MWNYIAPHIKQKGKYYGIDCNKNGQWEISAAAAEKSNFSAVITEHQLEVTLGKAKFALSDSLYSGWLSAGEGGNLNPAMEAQEGTYYLYTDETTLTEECGERYHVIRAATPLKNAEEGLPLCGAVAHTDLIFLYESRCAVVLTYFETRGYTPFREFCPCRASLVSGSVNVSLNGESRKLTEQPVILSSSSHYICRDLSEFDRYNPFITAFSEGEIVLPGICLSK